MTTDFSSPDEVAATISGLAALAVRQFERVRNGEIVRQDGTEALTPMERDVMARVSGHALVGGDSDIAASIHDLLALMALPFGDWPLSLFRRTGPEFSGISLIDQATLVPTVECCRLVARGGSEAVLEEALFGAFCDALEMTARNDAPAAYSFIRELVSRRPVIETADLLHAMDDAGFSSLYSGVLDLYSPAHHTPSKPRVVVPCGHCGAALAIDRSSGQLRCPLRQCRDQRAALAGSEIPFTRSLLAARPAILTYWIGPAQDELRIHDAALAAGKPSVLYDRLDSCDVLIDGRIAIDVKSYRSPILLAEKFNRDGIGGLMRYDLRILAVSDDLVAADPGYLGTFEAYLAVPLPIEVMSVSQAIRRFVDA